MTYPFPAATFFLYNGYHCSCKANYVPRLISPLKIQEVATLRMALTASILEGYPVLVLPVV